MIAANNHQPAVIALMGRLPARREPRRKLRSIKTREVRFLPGQPALQPQRMVVQHANNVSCFTGQ